MPRSSPVLPPAYEEAIFAWMVAWSLDVMERKVKKSLPTPCAGPAMSYHGTYRQGNQARQAEEADMKIFPQTTHPRVAKQTAKALGLREFRIGQNEKFHTIYTWNCEKQRWQSEVCDTRDWPIAVDSPIPISLA